MKYANHRTAIDELSASEGVFTTAQAARLDIPRNSLSLAVSSGRAERVVHGAYRLSSTASLPTDELTAIWKLTSPSRLTSERMAQFDGIVVGGTTAAALLGIGDFDLPPYRLFSPRRINSRHTGARFGVRKIEPQDVTWECGLPITRMERTLVDLCLDLEDPSLVRNAFADAMMRGMETERLEALVSSCEAEHGRRKVLEGIRLLIAEWET